MGHGKRSSHAIGFVAMATCACLAIEPTRLEAAGYCRCFRRLRGGCQSLARCGTPSRRGSTDGATKTRPTGQTDAGPIADDSRFSRARCRSLWISWKGLDHHANCQSHRRRIRRFLSQGPCFAIASLLALDASVARAPGYAARRRRNRKVAENCLAATESKGSTRTQNPCFYGRIGLLSAAGRRANLCARKANLRSSRSGKLATICR